ncbi:hypothetical protein BDN71DRAFT_1432963 [Pleurotus eryngii]|uniref:PUB domain-containing protein n=1 Tax=Pleurotus eryngii TaxID=5323 RepID=A0A9P5ZRV4_PLEER|nr:hypothetical protein BDN71DRAFT_1432963 [Pleurotus eryngii]
MSTPSSPRTGSPETSAPRIISPEALAAAAERRHQEHPAAGPTAAQLAEEHEKRQAFRRLINPGIFERNSREVYTAAIKILSTLAENLLREPDDPHYQQFKPTNSIIKQRLVDPKGTLEYAIAFQGYSVLKIIKMGFRAEVKNFQPYYVFNPRKLHDLQIGAAILKEALDRQSEKDERASRATQEEKEATEAALLKVKLAYMDDRKTKIMADERDRQLREAHAAVAAAKAQAASTDSSDGPVSVMRAASSTPSDDDNLQPPPYDSHQ